LQRQAQKTVGSISTRFIYSGFLQIADYNGSTLNNRYIFADFDEPIIQVTGSGAVSYIHRDQQNTIVAITNNSGAVSSKYTYSPFGESLALSGTTFGYTGQRYDAETGLYYYKARYFLPTIGRFLQPDPIGYLAGTLNLYAYVNNDPLQFLDPLGLQATQSTGTGPDSGSGPGPGTGTGSGTGQGTSTGTGNGGIVVPITPPPGGWITEPPLFPPPNTPFPNNWPPVTVPIPVIQEPEPPEFPTEEFKDFVDHTTDQQKILNDITAGTVPPPPASRGGGATGGVIIPGGFFGGGVPGGGMPGGGRR
jgi:RHS repeat-associated protein